MKDEQELYDFIDQYLKNADSSEGKALPEGVDAQSFEEELTYHKSIKQALLINRLGQVSQTLQKVDQEAKSKTTIFKLGIASLVGLGLGLAAVLYFTNTSSNPKSAQPAVVEALPKGSNSHKTEVLSPVGQAGTVPANGSSPVEKNQASKVKQLSNKIGELPSPAPDHKEQIHPIKSENEPSVHIRQVIVPEEGSKAVDPCKGVKLQAQYTFTNPCSGTANGTIEIEQASGGQAPYVYAINHKGFKGIAAFEGLAKGNYELSIRDANGCESDILAKVTLIETNCGDTETQNQVFNPAHEVWELPNLKTLAGTVELYNSKGVLVYRSNFGKFETINWDGRSLQGESTAPGVYIYKVQYEDSNVQQGSVTVVY